MDRPRLISSGIVLLATLDLLSALSVNGFGTRARAAQAASSSSPGQLLLVRHGESQWNRERRFTGWVDVPLTEQGEWDAASTARVLLEEYPRSIDVRRTASALRGAATSRIILARAARGEVRQIRAPSGGASTSATTARSPGRTRWRRWRRWTAPSSRRFASPSTACRRRWRPTTRTTRGPTRSSRRGAPAARATSRCRSTPCRSPNRWPTATAASSRCGAVELAPLVASGANVLVVGHANCLRALIKCVQGVDDAELPTLAVPNTIPLVYSFAIGGGDADVARAARRGVAGAEPKGGRALAPLVPETSDELCYIPPLRANYLGTECKEFEEIDTNHSGEIDAERSAANICSDDDECQTLIDEADTNATGKIDFKEYVAWERRRDLQKWFEQERKRQEPLPGKSQSKMGSGLGAWEHPVRVVADAREPDACERSTEYVRIVKPVLRLSSDGSRVDGAAPPAGADWFGPRSRWAWSRLGAGGRVDTAWTRRPLSARAGRPGAAAAPGRAAEPVLGLDRGRRDPHDRLQR